MMDVSFNIRLPGNIVPCRFFNHYSVQTQNQRGPQVVYGPTLPWFRSPSSARNNTMSHDLEIVQRFIGFGVIAVGVQGNGVTRQTVRVGRVDHFPKKSFITIGFLAYYRVLGFLS